MATIFIIVLATAIVTGGVLFGVNYWLARKNGETIAKRYLISLAVLLLIYTGLFCLIFYNYHKAEETFNLKAARLRAEQQRMREEQKAELEKMKAFYTKELAFSEWKNRVFTSSSQMDKELEQAKSNYQLSDTEVRTWKGVAENNTLDKLVPKRDSKEVLKEYQTRLKKSLSEVKSGHTLMNSDIRMLSENINAIRFVGKEYEKVLSSFRELYDSITSNNGQEPVMPKQQKFLFFPIKQKEYNQLLQQYYENRGNQQATAEIAVKLKDAIDKAEAEFKRINKKFEDNLGYLDSNAGSISYNSEKLQRLIEAAISEVELINENDSQTQMSIKINSNQKN